MDLFKFVTEILEAAFEGNDFDGGGAQELGVSCGVLIETTYDPEKHGGSEYDIEPGDTYYEWSPEFKALKPDQF